MQEDDDGQHNNGKGQHGDMRHDNGDGWHNNNKPHADAAK